MSSPVPGDHIWWLASRASGLVALALISASVLLGLAMASKLFRKPGLPRVLNALHEQLAVAGLIAIGIHGATLLGDPWLSPGVDGITLPFAIDYRPVWVAAGIAAGYLAAALSLSYYFRTRIGSKRWRNAHRYIVIAWALSIVHTLGAGTDAAIPVVRWIVLAPVVPVVALFAARMVPRRPPAPTRERPASRATQPGRARLAPARGRG